MTINEVIGIHPKTRERFSLSVSGYMILERLKKESHPVIVDGDQHYWVWRSGGLDEGTLEVYVIPIEEGQTVHISYPSAETHEFLKWSGR